MDFPFAIETSGPDETEAVGSRIAAALSAGDRLVLRGEVGAGKTTLARGICRGLGVTGAITSPTFTVVRRYEEGSVPISHLDLYRLSEGVDAEDPGLLEDEVSQDRIALIEWPEMASPAWLGATREVLLEHAGGDSRRVIGQ